MQPGETAAGVVVEMVDATRLEVALDVDELLLADMEVGQTAVVTLEAWPHDELPATVSAIAPRASDTSGALVTYAVYLQLEPVDLPVRLGMTANASLITQQVSDTLLLPNAAISVNRAAGTYSNSLRLCASASNYFHWSSTLNRLWVRFALVIAGVILLITLLPLLYTVAVMQELVPAPAAYRQMAEFQAQLPPDLQAQFAARMEALLGESILQTFVFAAVVGVLAGAWLSHLLAKPLQALEEGAQAVATQNPSHRVPVQGSREIKNVALAFNQMAAQLEQAEGLRRNLLADVAHELRNPLHILQGNLQAILDGVYPLKEEEIGRLLEQARHLARLTDDLHLLAQAEARRLPLQREIVDVAALVKETAAAFKPLAATKEIKLQVELLGSLPALPVDAARIRQVVHNLLANAMIHTPENGRILVQVELQDRHLRIQVQDSGPGIAPDQIPYIFDCFYRTDAARSREKGGAGLGLAIVKGIAEAHGGQVEVANLAEQAGSRFVVWLPLADAG